MQLLNLFDYEEAASAVMEPGAFAYYAGGVAENITRDENRRAFSRLRLRPKMLRDVSQPSMETEIMGVKSSMPVMLGRSPLWGLAVNGADGAHHVLELMREEIANAMAQCGCPTLADIGPDLIASI